VRLAFGAPCFFDEVGLGDSFGIALGVADGDTDCVGSGVSNGCGVGKLLFLRCGEGVGDVFFFFGLGEGGGDSVSDIFFFFVEGTGVGDSFSLGDDLFDGVGDGADNFFFVIADWLFFFRGFGVGVGVAKIFLIASPNDCSAA
jgi:hypothetical protein